VVLADGCFDPLHVGHIGYLEAASKLGNLFVHIASDEAIRAKGREPFQSRTERRHMVASLKFVYGTCDYPSLVDAIRQFTPNALVKGRDWLGKLPHDVVVACREVGTVIVYTDTQERTSTQRLNTEKAKIEQLAEKFIRDTDREMFKHGTGPTVRLDLDPKFYRGDPGDENDNAKVTFTRYVGLRKFREETQ